MTLATKPETLIIELCSRPPSPHNYYSDNNYSAIYIYIVSNLKLSCYPPHLTDEKMGGPER